MSRTELTDEDLEKIHDEFLERVRSTEGHKVTIIREHAQTLERWGKREKDICAILCKVYERKENKDLYVAARYIRKILSGPEWERFKHTEKANINRVKTPSLKEKEQNINVELKETEQEATPPIIHNDGSIAPQETPKKELKFEPKHIDENTQEKLQKHKQQYFNNLERRGLNTSVESDTQKGTLVVLENFVHEYNNTHRDDGEYFLLIQKVTK